MTSSNLHIIPVMTVHREADLIEAVNRILMKVKNKKVLRLEICPDPRLEWHDCSLLSVETGRNDRITPPPRED